MTIVCIDTNNRNDIELYHFYEGDMTFDSVEENSFQDGWIVTENTKIKGTSMWYPFKCFVTIALWREIQINDILSEQ